MASSQNMVPRVSAQKGVSKSQVGPKDGHSVSKRLQQDLMTLMVNLRERCVCVLCVGLVSMYMHVFIQTYYTQSS